MKTYPEHEKLHLIKDKSQAIGEFLEWLQGEQGCVIAQYSGDDLHPIDSRNEQLLAYFFEIDLVKLEKEKRAMLDELRKAQKPKNPKPCPHCGSTTHPAGCCAQDGHGG
jgi:tRNA(Ile2) C34 agmatinyltransferase TiaS